MVSILSGETMSQRGGAQRKQAERTLVALEPGLGPLS